MAFSQLGSWHSSTWFLYGASLHYLQTVLCSNSYRPLTIQRTVWSLLPNQALSVWPKVAFIYSVAFDLPWLLHSYWARAANCAQKHKGQTEGEEDQRLNGTTEKLETPSIRLPSWVAADIELPIPNWKSRWRPTSTLAARVAGRWAASQHLPSDLIQWSKQAWSSNHSISSLINTDRVVFREYPSLLWWGKCFTKAYQILKTYNCGFWSRSTHPGSYPWSICCAPVDASGRGCTIVAVGLHLRMTNLSFYIRPLISQMLCLHSTFSFFNSPQTSCGLKGTGNNAEDQWSREGAYGVQFYWPFFRTERAFLLIAAF